MKKIKIILGLLTASICIPLITGAVTTSKQTSTSLKNPQVAQQASDYSGKIYKSSATTNDVTKLLNAGSAIEAQAISLGWSKLPIHSYGYSPVVFQGETVENDGDTFLDCTNMSPYMGSIKLAKNQDDAHCTFIYPFHLDVNKTIKLIKFVGTAADYVWVHLALYRLKLDSSYSEREEISENWVNSSDSFSGILYLTTAHTFDPDYAYYIQLDVSNSYDDGDANIPTDIYLKGVQIFYTD